MRWLVVLVFLLLIPAVLAQDCRCVNVCDENGSVPINIKDGLTEANPLGFSLMVIIISMSILAGWWIKASIVKVMGSSQRRRSPSATTVKKLKDKGELK